jgi:hypothetical protein
LTVTVAGSGTVTSTPAGINCGSDCSETLSRGTVVTLKATPASGQAFSGWGGACAGTGDCVLTMNAAATVTATFVASGATGPAAKLGDPSATPFNGIVAVLDRWHRVPKHAVPAVTAPMPAPLSGASLPYLSDINVLSRRDALIVYVPNIAGAADYRAYAVKSGVTFVDSVNGRQPRGAVIACAGFRRHFYEPVPTPNGQRTRELMQALELPGLVNDGSYTIIVEALKTPCPYTGHPGHTDALLSDNANKWGDIKSPQTVLQAYGNEIINGQGARTAWANRNSSAPLGLAVPPDSSEFPKDPVVIARSALSLTLPAADETINAPIIDVGPNAMFDDFEKDLSMAGVVYPDPWHNYPLGTIPGEWAFWGAGLEAAEGQGYGAPAFRGMQVLQRHGRLYNTFGDWEQGVLGTMSFSSLKTLPQQLDDTKYLHSFFRVNSDATPRRYWSWTLCGGATREELVDVQTRMPRIRPLTFPNMMWAGADNPTVRGVDQPADPSRYNKECLQIAQIGGAEAHWPRDGGDRAASSLVTVLFPAGTESGIVGLGTANSGGGGDNGFSSGYFWRLDSAGNRAGPLIEPFDQLSPLTHFDIFLRRDRLLIFINGRQGICVNLKPRPLTMKYGLVTYGNVLYHSSAEVGQIEDADASDSQYRLNTPISDTRAWDAIGHAERIDIPSQFVVDESTCFAPMSTAVH